MMLMETIPVNVNLQFEDSTDPRYLPKTFPTIMNAIFQNSSKFGTSHARTTVDGVSLQIYRTNSVNTDSTHTFANLVNGKSAKIQHAQFVLQCRKNAIEEKLPIPYGVVDPAL